MRTSSAVSNEDVKINLTNRRWGVVRAADDPFVPDGSAEHKRILGRLWSVVPKDGTVTDEAAPRSPVSANCRLPTSIRWSRRSLAQNRKPPSWATMAWFKLGSEYLPQQGRPVWFNLLTAEDVAKHVGAGSVGN